jgi:hypothetical protein
VLFCEPASFDSDAILHIFLVVVVEKLGSCGIVGKEEQHRKDANDCEKALNDKKPPEALQAAVAVEVADAVCDATSKGTSCSGRSKYESYAYGSLFDGIPERDTDRRQLAATTADSMTRTHR